MTTKKSISINVLWNWIGTVCGIASGFVVAPYLVRHLGESGYGLWILIASLTGYFSLLDLGVRGSVGRHIAFHRAKADQSGVNASLSTAVAMLCGGSVFALLLTFVAQIVFFRLFDVPVSGSADARLALLIVGLNLALSLPLSVFDATLWAFQRFDVLNAIDVPAIFLRIGLTFLLIDSPDDLTLLAVITLVSALIPSLAKAYMSFRIDPALRIRFSLVSRDAARPLLGYGSWYFLLSVGRLLNYQISPIIIGTQLGVLLVTPYSIAMRLIGGASSCIVAATGVFTPIATANHAGEKHDEQKRLLLEGGKYCLAMSLFFFFMFVFLGGPLIDTWMGGKMSTATRLLSILSAGEALPMSQLISTGIILGMGRHRALAFLSLIENVLIVAISLIVVKPYGVLGMCCAYAVCGTLFRGIAQLLYSCAILDVRINQYFRSAILPTLLTSMPPLVVLASLVMLRPPSGMQQLFVYLLAYGLTWAIPFAFLSGAAQKLIRSRWLSPDLGSQVLSGMGDPALAEGLAK